MKCGQDQQTDFDMYNVDLYFSTIPCHSLFLYAIGTPFMILKYFPLFAAATSHNKVSSEHIWNLIVIIGHLKSYDPIAKVCM